jgi:O-succinylbenzoic acid--CoA ligase
LLAHQDVLEAGVTGLVDAEWGQVPIAFIIKKEGTNPSSEELEQFCKERLGKYKVPKAFYFMEELPRNASKKLLRRELKKWVKEGRTNDDDSIG